MESGKRTGAWLKYRINRGQEFVAGGYTPDLPFDALIVGYYEGDKLYYVAKVRNGFVPQVRRDVYSNLSLGVRIAVASVKSTFDLTVYRFVPSFLFLHFLPCWPASLVRAALSPFLISDVDCLPGTHFR